MSTAPGDKYRLEADQAGHYDRKLAAVMRAATLNGSHVWAAMAAFYVPDPEDPGLVLGPDNLMTYPQLGCYRCEEPYEPRLRTRRCPGDPR